MASLRTFGSTSTSIMRSALTTRFSLNHMQTRTVLTVTAFERAMQEVHGANWKDGLNHKQKQYVTFKETSRANLRKKMQAEHGDKWEAEAAKKTAETYASPEFQNKFRTLKQSLLEKKK